MIRLSISRVSFTLYFVKSTGYLCFVFCKKRCVSFALYFVMLCIFSFALYFGLVQYANKNQSCFVKKICLA